MASASSGTTGTTTVEEDAAEDALAEVGGPDEVDVEAPAAACRDDDEDDCCLDLLDRFLLTVWRF